MSEGPTRQTGRTSEQAAQATDTSMQMGAVNVTPPETTGDRLDRLEASHDAFSATLEAQLASLESVVHSLLTSHDAISAALASLVKRVTGRAL
jgi:hypothetical protein